MNSLSMSVLWSLLFFGIPALAEDKASDSKASPKTELTQATFLINGLHCPPCTTTVRQSLVQAKGVKSVAVDWTTKNARIEFDESVLSAQQLTGLIANTPHMMGGDMRYDAWLALKVKGIDKPEIADKTKAFLMKQKGIQNVAFYPQQEAIGVHFTPGGNLTLTKLIKSLGEQGISAQSYSAK